MQPNDQCFTFDLLSQSTMMRAAVSVWVLAALVCGGSSIPIEQVAQNAAVDSGVSLVSTGNKDFAFQLYRKLAAHADSQGKNVFYSPSSVSLALAALSAGARGKTHKQIFAGLGFNDTLLTQKAVNEAFHDLLESGDKESKEAKSEGTAVFLDDNFKAKPEFLDVLKKSYFADGFTVDFAQTQPTIDTINKYVSDMTNGKINKMVEGLSENTIMYLLSYITFKGNETLSIQSLCWDLSPAHCLLLFICVKQESGRLRLTLN